MDSIMDQNFYEVLEVPTGGTLQQIERAYRIARATFQPGSVATYSVYSDEESSAILRRIEEAYAVLSDARLRREYDARLRREGMGDLFMRASDSTLTSSPAPSAMPVETRPRPPSLELNIEAAYAPEDGIYDGPVLRRIRMSLGVELEEISAITKVSQLYLQFLEENRYHDLPAPVYIRGFLREFAKCLNLDARRVTETYMERYRKRLEES